MTLQPYPAGTEWRFHYLRKPSVVHVSELVLYAEPLGCWVTDDFVPDEITPRQLWDRWVANPDIYLDEARTQVHIRWSVTTPQVLGHFEAAPFATDHPELEDTLHENFLTFFSWPVNTVTGERLNWLRLPVLDRGWKGQRADKGGFIQELLGWKPGPLQPHMNPGQLAQAAGIA